MPLAKDGLWVLILLFAFCTLAGCSAPPTPPYPKWMEAEPSVEASGALADYARAADRAEEITGKDADRVHFTPGMKRDLAAKLGPALSMAIGASDTGDFGFSSRGPFDQPPHHKGWWALGQALAWRIESAVVEENFDRAVTDTVAATRFGFALSGGSAIDASLGLAIADRARRAIAPALPRLGAGQLQALANGVEAALAARPSMSAVVANERLNMLRAVQHVQDLYRDNGLKELRDKLGPDVADAVTHLDQLHAKDASKRPAYFEGFAAEADATCDWLTRLAPLSASMREKEPELKLAKERPWWRFAKHFFGAVQPLFPMRDATVARARLLVLEALVLKAIKLTGAAPRDLSAYSEAITQDPYSGRSLIYRAEGADYRLYSVGEDLKDDGGESDDSFSSPDLVVERG